ncbi:MAG: MBOAT family O-acyltransferase [Bacillota bacterium]|nr:MBOAT family O-acyltransferase [Bacillota bacterium]
MVFSSLVFLCIFLPVNLFLYFIIKNRTWRNWILILSSLFFYAWGEPVWITAMIFSGVFDYFNGLMVEKYHGTKEAKFFVALSITGNLLLLGAFKYSGFFVENINALFGLSLNVPRISLPIGISFYTFQTISYVVDVYRGEVKAQRSPFKFMLFVSLFHQLVAGPIVRYSDIAAEIEHREVTATGFSEGVNRFIIGLGKKVLIANTAGELALSFLGTDYEKLPVAGAWLGILLYAFQIYFDFSGYSDMAIGLGRMYGFTYKENFNYPYISKSATEFWRRWHISLGSFFRDYLYIPLGGNRRNHARNLLVVWFLTGLWHGASWNFIIWGLYYFVFVFAEKLFLKKLLDRIPAFFSRIYLLLIVLVGWVFFYHIDMGEGLRFLGVMFGRAYAFTNSEVSILFRGNALFLVLAVIASTPLAKRLFEAVKTYFLGNRARVVFMDRVFKPVINIFILVLSLAFLVGQSYNPFLYFRF